MSDANAESPRSAMPFDPEDDRQGEIQSLVGNHGRRLRHWIGSSHHRQGRLIEGRVTRSLDDAGRENMTPAVQREGDDNLCSLLRAFCRITLVLVEMGDQLLLPGHPDALRAL